MLDPGEGRWQKWRELTRPRWRVSAALLSARTLADRKHTQIEQAENQKARKIYQLYFISVLGAGISACFSIRKSQNTFAKKKSTTPTTPTRMQDRDARHVYLSSSQEHRPINFVSPEENKNKKDESFSLITEM